MYYSRYSGFLRVAIITPLLLIPCAGLPAESDAYLCISDMSTGFAYKGGKWQTTDFNVDDEKFVLRKRKEGEETFFYGDSPWLILKLGSSDPDGGCKEGFNEYGYINCNYELFGEFKMNHENGRFLATYLSGYHNANSGGRISDGDETPSITIGKCTAI